MRTDFLLLAIYEKPRLNFAETCDVLGISLEKRHNLRATGGFPIPMIGNPLGADIRDVAIELDRLLEEGRLRAAAWRLYGKDMSIAEWIKRGEYSDRRAG